MFIKNIAIGSALLLPALLSAGPVLGEVRLPAQKTATDTPYSEYQSESKALVPELAPEIRLPIEPEITKEDRERLDATRAISQYTETIHQLEAEEGAYSRTLSENLAGLGDAYSKLGNHEEALTAYRRALLVHRSNHGLHNLGQEAYLERVMETHRVLGMDENLNNNHDYLLWLYRRNYDGGNPQLLPTLIRVASWKLEAFARQPIQKNVDYLFEAEELFEQSLHIVDTNPEMDDRMAIDHLYDIAAENFTAGFFLSSYQLGRDAIQKVIDIHNDNEALPRTSLAEAWVLLGDWEMSFNNSRRATEHYRNAYQILNEDGASQKAMNRLFGKPRSLTQLEVPTKPTQFEQVTVSTAEASAPGSGVDKSAGRVHIDELANSGTEFVLAEFDVSSSGRVRDLEIIRSNPEGDVRFRRNARDRILRVPFRPRLESGELVNTKDFVMLYKFQ